MTSKFFKMNIEEESAHVTTGSLANRQCTQPIDSDASFNDENQVVFDTVTQQNQKIKKYRGKEKLTIKQKNTSKTTIQLIVLNMKELENCMVNN